jgi:membrane-bound metal-dependent hydrolase YbcI (DUF457 family)
MQGRLNNLKQLVIGNTIFLAGLWLGLWLPDTDLILLPVLHHRSIITHSILIPYLAYLFFSKRIPGEFVAGLYAGIAIHLSADMLSTMTGFAMIWLPWPIKFPLGPLSIVWMLGNAFLGLFWAIKMSPNNKKIAFSMVVVVALAYAIFNEAAFVPFVVFGLIGSSVVWISRHRSNKRKKSEAL